MRLRALAAGLTLLVLSGCAPAPSGAPSGPAAGPSPAIAVPDQPPPGPPPEPPGPSTEPHAPPPEPDPQVRLAFVGDILLGGGLAGIIDHHGPDYPWRHAATILKRADLTFGNLETAVSTRGKPVPDKRFTFRSRPGSLRGAANAGIDVLSLANNHAMDYGPQALLDTIRHVRAAGIHPVGAGRNRTQAFRPLILAVKGLKIATLAFTRVIPTGDWAAGPAQIGLASGYDPAPVLAAIDDVRPRADVVVVLFHWGEELADRPRPTDLALAQEMIGHGATVVVGHHPHVLQGIQRQDGQLIAYSLGNFIFTSGSRRETRETGILEVTVGRAGVADARFTPMLLAGGQPRPAGAQEGDRILSRLGRLSQPGPGRVAPDGRIMPP